MPEARHVTVYFDGECNLCNAFVDFLIRRDRWRALRYASRQGKAFAALAARHPELSLPDADTMVTVVAEGDREKLYLRSDASLTATAQLPGVWKAATVLKIIPLFLRNAVYNFIARHRYQIFGKRATCRLPSPEERDLFLD